MATGFEDLQVGQKARALAGTVYRGGFEGPLSHDFGLRDQRMASVAEVSRLHGGLIRARQNLRRSPSAQLRLIFS